MLFNGGFVDIYGQIGSGKTYTSHLFIQRMLNNYNVKVVAIDPLNEFDNTYINIFNDLDIYNPVINKNSVGEYVLNVISELNENSNQRLIFLVDESHHIPINIKSEIITYLKELQNNNIYKSVLGIFTSQNTNNVQKELTDIQIIHKMKVT